MKLLLLFLTTEGRMGVLSKETVNFTALLTFVIEGVEYCVNNGIVTSIIEPDKIYNLPTTSALKYSLLRVGKKIIPLLDLKKIFRGEEQKINSLTRVIIIEYKETQFGLLVEKAKELIAADSDSLRTSGKFILEENDIHFTEGTLKLGNKELLFLNIDKIIKQIAYF